MHFEPLPLPGAFLVHPTPVADERGHFARIWCELEFAHHGILEHPVQMNTGFNPQRGTLRGLHFQVEPGLETKMVRCTAGAVFDVVVDLRPESRTRYRWFGVELVAGTGQTLVVPSLCAHGYLTLKDDSEVEYLTTAPYTPEAARGVRYDDPSLRIKWPAQVSLVSDRDRSWPLLPTDGLFSP